MHWNYRVIKHEEGGHIYYAIHECYYGDADTPAGQIPNSWTEEPIDCIAESTEALLIFLGRCVKAVHLPTLEIHNETLREVAP